MSRTCGGRDVRSIHECLSARERHIDGDAIDRTGWQDGTRSNDVYLSQTGLAHRAHLPILNYEPTRLSTSIDHPSMESTLAAIRESKSADQVFAAVNGFLAKIQKTTPIFQTLPGDISIHSMQDIRTWLQGLRRMANTTTGVVIPSGDTLAEMYAVLRVALRKLEVI